MRRASLQGFLGVCGMVLGPLAYAQTCPDRFPDALPSTAVARQNALDQSDTLRQICENRADYHAWRGSLLLLQRVYEEAMLALEKAILLDPNLPGAQLDYAQALAQSGQTPAATAIVAAVAKREDILPGLRDWLDQQLQRIGIGRWALAIQAEAGPGYESNLNSATHVSSLTLTLPSGLVEVPLADSERPISGQVLRGRLVAQLAKKQLEGDEWRLLSAATVRQSQGHPETDLANLELAAERVWQNGRLQWQLAAQTQALWQDNAILYREAAGQVGVNWHFPGGFPGTHYKAGLALQHAYQHYPQTERLSGHETALQGRLSHQADTGTETTARLTLLYNAALDPTRPGGDKARTELRLQHRRRLAGGWLTLTGQHSRTRDAEPYSALLGDTHADIGRTEWGLDYWQPLSRHWSAGLSLQKTSQTSSIALFKQENEVIFAGLRWATE